MIEYLSYFIFFISIIVTILYFYIKYKYGFWVIQPVFHIYDIGYMIKSPGIINHGLPHKNKYTNFINIETTEYKQLAPFFISKMVKLINNHYFREKNNFFRLQDSNFTAYFKGHNDMSFVSFYNEPTHLLNKANKAKNLNNTFIVENKIISVMTSRPLHVTINNGEKDAHFDCYYVDYLCVHKSYRKNGIAPQMIQTHHYNQSHINKKISISLFKREDELTGIIPLCVYSTYGFSVDKWTKPYELSSEYKFVKITSTNIHLLYNFIKEQETLFDILITCEISNLIELVNTNNVYVYVLIDNDEIVAAYFFRKTCIFIDSTLEVLSCFASINCSSLDIFVHGFKILFWKIAAEHYFGYCSIENISHNDLIIDKLLLKNRPLVISPTAYFFYNFVYKTSPSNKVFIIN